ncbi:MAG: T9SS type A sorting domain-containing protein, partial [Muribaculaceae bacterium]|nr:T9SS type A sorting domain-containing protein [Muribaculaceae bacterium]
IAWFNADGSFSHTDEVSLGMGVHYAKSLIESKSLMPSTYHSDKHREYLVLIKRGGEGSSISEEFIVGQARSEEYPDGRTLLYLTPGEKGSIEAIIPYTVSSNPVLATSFYSKAGRSVDFYQLPLDGDVSGIGQKPADGTDTTISGTGNLRSAQGQTIRIYSIHGICLASADESLDISILSPGTYIVKAGNAAKKIIKK